MNAFEKLLILLEQSKLVSDETLVTIFQLLLSQFKMVWNYFFEQNLNLFESVLRFLVLKPYRNILNLIEIDDIAPAVLANVSQQSRNLLSFLNHSVLLIWIDLESIEILLGEKQVYLLLENFQSLLSIKIVED